MSYTVKEVCNSSPTCRGGSLLARKDKDLIQEMHDNNIRREGREAGIEEGREAGMVEGSIRAMLQLYVDGDIPDEVITKRLDCTKEEIPGLLKQYEIE